jgi:hypothetical protein
MLREKYDKGEIPVWWSEGGEPLWTYKVACSEGHENVFEGTERP